MILFYLFTIFVALVMIMHVSLTDEQKYILGEEKTDDQWVESLSTYQKFLSVLISISMALMALDLLWLFICLISSITKGGL